MENDMRMKRVAYVVCFLLWLTAAVLLALVIDFRRVLAVFSAGWCVLAVVNAVIAKVKNKSMLLWFLFTLLLGPVATVLLLLSKSNSQAKA